MTLSAVVEESQQKVDYLACAKRFQLVCILYIHYLIANVVGSLHKIHEGVAAIHIFVLANQPHLIGNADKQVALGGEESEFALGIGSERGIGIFHNRGKHGIGHGKSSRSATLELVHEQAE